MKYPYFDPRREDSAPYEERRPKYYDPAPTPASGHGGVDESLYITGGETEIERARGCSWLLVFILTFVVGSIALISYGVNRMIGATIVQELHQNYRAISLLPSHKIQTPKGDMQLQIYYIARGRALAPEARRLRRATSENERLRLIAQELRQPPSDRMLENPLPSGTEIRGVYLMNNIAYIDLSSEFTKVERATPLKERLAIYALVNSLALNNPSIQGVQIMINGWPAATAWGWLDISSPLGPDLSLQAPAREPGETP